MSIKIGWRTRRALPATWILPALVLVACRPTVADGPTIAPSSFWKNQIVFPDDPFCARGISQDSIRWVKFTILLEPYDPNLVYFQDSRRYVFHYGFAADLLAPFAGMTSQQFNAVTFFERDQQAILGTVILPPLTDSGSVPLFQEYGIQFVRQDAFPRERIRELFALVEANVVCSPDVQAFYFPTYEQQAAAEADRQWFASHGILLGSTARWAQGNVGYSQGWAIGKLKFFSAGAIADAYQKGLLESKDILLTDGIPAELPHVAGIMTLAPSTPNSHVAILANTYGVPFVYLAVSADALAAQQMVGHTVIVGVYEDSYGACNLRLLDVEGRLDDDTATQIMQLKKPATLAITPVAERGAIGVSTEGLAPCDVQYVGGKAANFSILRQAVPENSPKAIALTFDVWNAFLDQPLTPTPSMLLPPGGHIVFWATGEEQHSPVHTNFRLSKDGESIALFDADGAALIDVVHFEKQRSDVSYGRSADGGGQWQFFSTPTPGRPNSDGQPVRSGLVINEFMADNTTTVQDPCRPGDYPDWIELYNATDDVIVLDGLYLTDDLDDPTKWQIRPAISGPTLREEIARRLSEHHRWPPEDMWMLSRDLAAVRSLFTNSGITQFSADLRGAIVDVLADPAYGFDPAAMLRFRSSTNVEDSEDFVGAGLYDSFSGCLADDLDEDGSGPCACDPTRAEERSVFRAIRQVFASFYNDNAFLERLRHDVDPAEVGMAVLVHHSFPDDIELANGVATVEVTGDRSSATITLVSQQGAVSITNPQDASIAEEVVVQVLPSGSVVPPKLERLSSLVPLGGTVMTWRDDYTDLTDLLLRVSDAFRYITGKEACLLDFEYKKVVPGAAALPEGGLVVKQVRELPTPGRGSGEDSVLINVPATYEVFPGEFELLGQTDLFADHRLKSRWRFETRTMVLDINSLSEALYGDVDVELLDEDRRQTLSGAMAQWPSAQHGFDGQGVVDTWRIADLSNPRTYHLYTTGISAAVLKGQNPLFLTDFGDHAFDLPYRCLALEVEYDRPVAAWHQQLWPADPPSGFSATRKNKVYLWSPPEPGADDVLQERHFASDGISIHTSFYFPPPPAGYPDWTVHTAPLLRWDRTVIEGLSGEPIVLCGHYAQTFRPEHHNLVEGFLFEPRLEPDLSTEILDQLRQADVRFIHLVIDNQGGRQSRIATYGYGDLDVAD